MACVTLKRPIEVLGSPHLGEHQPMAKRKRCGPSLFPTTPPCSPSRGISVKRAKRRLEVDDHYSPPTTSSALSSPFISAAPPIQTGMLKYHCLVCRVCVVNPGLAYNLISVVYAATSLWSISVVRGEVGRN